MKTCYKILEKTKYREFKVQSLTYISNQICQLRAKNFWAQTEII
jgi:hypothetical protein